MLDQNAHADALGDDFEALLREVFVAISELPVPDSLIAIADRLDIANRLESELGDLGGQFSAVEFSREAARS